MSLPFTLVAGAAPAPGGEPFYVALIASAGRVVAADAAAEWCMRLGRTPDLAVGDLDSAARGADDRLRRAGVPLVRLDAEKDVSDLDACVQEVRRRAWGPVTLTAAFVGRFDHTLASVGAAMRAADLGARIEEPGWSATVVEGSRDPVVLELPEGTMFSVLAPAGAEGVDIRGARFELASAKLDPLSSLGISNVAAAGPVVVSVARGTLLVVVPRHVDARF